MEREGEGWEGLDGEGWEGGRLRGRIEKGDEVDVQRGQVNDHTYVTKVTGIEGNFRETCNNVMRVLRENKDSVMAVLEAFVYDPLLNWRLIDGEYQEVAINQQVHEHSYKALAVINLNASSTRNNKH